MDSNTSNFLKKEGACRQSIKKWIKLWKCGGKVPSYVDKGACHHFLFKERRRKLLKEKAEKIKYILLDVDGTMTDGSIILDNNGIESKKFNVKDGFAIANAIKNGINVGIITGRKSEVVSKRAKELGIKEVHQGITDKSEILKDIAKRYKLTMEEIAYMGDDINDYPIISKVGFKAVPSDGAKELTKIADFISIAKGGEGAVREFVELILEAKGIWKDILKKYNLI